MMATSSGVGGGTLGFLSALATAPTAAVTRYVIADRQLLGAALEQTTTKYNSGVATGGSTTTLVDASAFWTSASGNSGTSGSTGLTLGTVSPGNINGWYVSGTGIAPGAQVSATGGAGTVNLGVTIPHTGTVSGAITFSAWNTSLIGRRIKVQSGATGLNQELLITGVTPTTGTITFGTATAPVNNVAVYSLLSQQVKGAGHTLNWVSNNSIIPEGTVDKGRYIYSSKGGAQVGWERLNLNTDRVSQIYAIPAAESLTTGTMYAYDGNDRIYFTKDLTQRLYYLDVNTLMIHGAGIYPYVTPTTGIGNKMEIFTTVDGLKYLWINRQQTQEHFRQLLFF
jgi:hypothetical protein